MAHVERKQEKKFPVAEIFGPTIQGEGVDQGTACYFVRFGGCDYHCDWCDTPHAVLPEFVRRADRMPAEAIVQKIAKLTPGPRWVVLSGGNPCLHDLGPLVVGLQLRNYKVSLETQGTRRKEWVKFCNRIAVSPKPPSSGHVTDYDILGSFLSTLCSPKRAFLKVVVFNQEDYAFAREVHLRYPQYEFILSAGNDAGPTVGNPSRKDDRSDFHVALDLISRGRDLANRVMVDPAMKSTRVQMQQHVLYWGNQRGR